MPVSIVVGGQYGSEGKGKVACFFAEKLNAKVAVRVGGINSGHTVVTASGSRISFQILPTAAILPNIKCVLPAGMYFEEELLFEEIERAHLDEHNLFIDPKAVLITPEMKAGEEELKESIGSTGSGTGTAVVSRIMRDRKKYPFKFAGESPALDRFTKDDKGKDRDTKQFLRGILDKSEHIIIEGTQGYGLSLLHSPFYPFITSRDTTAAGFLSETGLSPLDVEIVIMVIRTFPIRVSGNSGPLCYETNWESVKIEAQADYDLTEYTTVTKKIRRVAYFDAEIVKQAITANNPNIIVLNHCDYFDNAVYQKPNLSRKVAKKIREIERSIGKPIQYIGTSERDLFPQRGL
ncbi:adenylosuccinate synthetase [Spirochaetia bacterium]|nr:adenylosuccinate synthetase [Spirochaetia bacterium]